MAAKKGEKSYSFTNTKGEKVVKYKTGEKTVTGSLGTKTTPASLPKGLKQVEQDGKVFTVREGSKGDLQRTAGGATDYAGIGVLSSNRGKDIVKQADEMMNRLAPEPITAQPATLPSDTGTGTTPVSSQPETLTSPTTATSPDTSKDYVEYLNESTGQTQTLRGSAINDTNRKALEEQGYKIATADTSTSIQAQQDPEIARLEQSISQYDNQIADFMQGLSDTLITDKELRSEIRGLKNTYKQRVSDARNITEQRVQALNTLGIRTGSRYTGGSNGVIGSIISEEENQGLRRITAIDSELETKINEAKRSAQDQNYKVYAQQMQYAEKLKEQKVAEVAALKKVAAEENKKKVELARTSLIDSVISSFIDQGVTNRGELFAKLSDPAIAGVIGGVTAEEFKKTFDALMPTGTGIIGEYEYYKREAQRMGQTPLSFDDYQTRDANRKRSITNNVIGGSDLSTKELTVFNSLVEKYGKSPLVAANDRAVILRDTVKALETDPTNSALQVTFIYSMIQALDTYQSAVREGEISLLSSTQGIKEQIQNLPDQISQGTPLSEDAIKKYMATASMLTTSINNAAQKKQKDYQAQANINGTKVGDAFQAYSDAVNTTSTATTALQDEEKAGQRMAEVYTQYGSQIEAILQEDPSLSNTDILEILGIQP